MREKKLLKIPFRGVCMKLWKEKDKKGRKKHSPDNPIFRPILC